MVLNPLPEEWGNFTSSLYGKKEATPFHDLWSLCKIEETRLKAKVDTGPSEENHAFATTYRKKGRLGKFGPRNKRRNMENVRCFGCNELGHYKRDCPISGKDKRKEPMLQMKGKNLMLRNLRKRNQEISIMIEIIFFFK